MSYSIEWSDDAMIDYENTVKYIGENWGKESALKFRKVVDKQIVLISQMPGMYGFADESKKFHRCVLVKQVSLYYIKVELEKKVSIIRLLNNSRSPDLIKKELDLFEKKQKQKE